MKQIERKFTILDNSKIYEWIPVQSQARWVEPPRPMQSVFTLITGVWSVRCWRNAESSRPLLLWTFACVCIVRFVYFYVFIVKYGKLFPKMRCAVYGCHSDNQSKGFSQDVSFFTFPKDKKMALEWVRLCKREDKFNVVNARICSNHFTKEDYVRNLRHELLQYTAKNYRSLKREAVPSQNLPQLLKRVQKDCQESARDERQKKRQRKELVETILLK